MKNSDKLILIRIYTLLDVPLPQLGLGSKSASVEGAIKYGRDMGEILGPLRNVLRQLWQGEDWPGAIEENVQQAEQWYAKRKAEDWQ